jgi:hypothetical protein
MLCFSLCYNAAMKDQDERAIALLKHVDGPASKQWHGGPGWYYWDESYPDEGSVGPFKTEAEARVHATQGDYEIKTA